MGTGLGSAAPTIGCVRAFDPQHTPQVLRPARVNTRVLIGIGAAGWLIAIAVLGVLLWLGFDLDARLLPMCAAGLALGCVGYLWARSQRQEEQ